MRLAIGVSVLALGLSLSGGAFAQSATQSEAMETGAGGIQDIVVTAQRREESLQRVAVPVSVLTGDEIVSRGVSSPQDLTKLVPAVRVAGAAGGNVTASIRGIGAFSGTPYGEPSVAFNLDGAYIARNTSLNGLFYDLERVEVLKGPQGTLYGRNATAGAINVITHKPEGKWAAEGTFEFGNYRYRRGVLALNAPLGEDAAIRVAGTISRRDGFFKDGYDDDHADGLRASLKLTPTSNLSILITADYQKIDQKGDMPVISPFLNLSNPFLGATLDGNNVLLRNVSLALSQGMNPNLLPSIGTDGFVKLENWGVTANVALDLGGAELTIIPAYRKSDKDSRHYGAGYPVDSDEHSETASFEVRLSSKPGDNLLSWLVGGYFFGEDVNYDLLSDNGVSFNRDIPFLKTRSYSAFGQATLSLSENFRILAGARYSEEHKSQTGLTGGPLPSVPVGFPGPAEAFYNAVCAPYDVAAATCFAPLQGELDQKKVTWKAGFEWDAAPHSLIYGNVSTGFKAGGFFASQVPNSYRPELLTAYTLGTKNRFFNNTLQINLEAFYWDYKDKQVTFVGPIQPAGFNLVTQNAGKAGIYGAELDLLWQPSPRDRITVGVQYLHARYDVFRYTQTTALGAPLTNCATSPVAGQANVIVDCSGRPFDQAPTWTANLAYNREFELGNGSTVDAFLGTHVESGYWLGINYLPGQYQKTTMVSNASITWRSSDKRFSVSGFVENIEDKVVRSFAATSPFLRASIVSLRPPRTYGARLGFSF